MKGSYGYASRPGGLAFAPHRSALIVVDVQNDFCHLNGAQARTGADMSAITAMVPRLQGFIDEARRAGVRIVFVQTTHDEMTDSPVWLARTQTDVSQSQASRSMCRSGTWGADFYLVSPERGEPVIVKHRYSAFAGTSLDVVLHAAAADSLLFTGVSTEVCVESSLRDGLFLDYHVALVEDCCASCWPESHSATVDVVGRAFGLVTTRDRVTKRWSATCEARSGPG
jgi:ureidoacrylate peracid hydrolase